MNAKDYAAEWKWMSSTEAKQRSAAAKSHALSEFKKRFPRADMSKFIAQAEFDANRKQLRECCSQMVTALGRTRSSKTKSTGRSLSKTLWGCHQMVAFLISYH